MRKVARPAEAPPYLSSPEVEHQRAAVLAYLRRPPQEREQRRDGLDDGVFYHRELRAALLDVFEGKCAFCEARIDDEGQVVHFRPLRFSSNGRGASDKDYYLWLAFEWHNLLYCCSECGQLKGDLFPVSGARVDYLAPLSQARQREASLLLDPTFDDPTRHMRFLCDGSVLALTPRGEATIGILQLNRLRLRKQRQELFTSLLHLLLSRDSRQATEEAVSRLTRPGTAHAGAAQNLLKRVSATWLASIRIALPVSGGFLERFSAAVRGANSAQRELLIATIRAVQEADLSIGDRGSESWVAPESVYSVASQRQLPLARYQLERVSIANFKALDSLQLSFAGKRPTSSAGSCLMILGENSTGKSTVLSAIALALLGRRQSAKLRGDLKSFVRSTSIDRFDQLDELPVEVRVRFQFSDEESWFRFDPLRNRVEGSENPATVVLGYGPRRFFNRKIRSRKHGGFSCVRTLFDPLATIPYPLDWLRGQSGARMNTIFAALRVVLALDENDELVLNDEQLAVRANGRITPIDALSEGYRSVFIMTVDIIRELLEYWNNIELAQAVVLIDELETHLHPRWKMQVMSSLRRVFPRVQFIVTTHDPLCLRGMHDGEVVVLERDAGQRIRVIEGLPPVSGMTSEQLLTSDYFGLSSTADPSTELQLARLASDVVRRVPSGIFQVSAASATNDLVGRLTIGDSPSEQLVQQAISTYLKEREARSGQPLPELRAAAVSKVLAALKGGF
jgi:uncharacterized protein (TIGR02646 family)